jgi:hypothetical protein
MDERMQQNNIATAIISKDSASFKIERKWALKVALLAMAITMIPYLFGYSLTGAGPAFSKFNWLGYNIDDSLVYFSWMRQSSEGHFFQLNLFTTEKQKGHQFNLFFDVLGWLKALLHIPIWAIYHISRMTLGVLFLYICWRFIEVIFKDVGARKTVFLMLCFSAGLGWIPGLWKQTGLMSPVDVWQPEAITFLCLYLSPLFLISLILMVGIIGGLYIADKTGSWKAATYAGIFGLILGNIHTYDVITLITIWSIWLIVQSIRKRRMDWLAWGHAFYAGAWTAISTGYMFYIFQSDAVFHKRVDVPTLSPTPWLYLAAYAPQLLLALIGLYMVWKKGWKDDGNKNPWLSQDIYVFLWVWSLATFLAAYLPVAYQRKMLMGEHIPLSFLAGASLWMILSELNINKKYIWVYCTIAFLSITNIRFMLRDMTRYVEDRSQSMIHRPYLYAGEVRALDWIRDHTPRDAPVQPLPWITITADHKLAFYDITLANMTPGKTGHAVEAGHWGETPDFIKNMDMWVHFILPGGDDQSKIDLLRETGIRYIIFSQKRPETHTSPEDTQLLREFLKTPPSWLKKIPEASSEDADVYEVRL